MSNYVQVNGQFINLDMIAGFGIFSTGENLFGVMVYFPASNDIVFSGTKEECQSVVYLMEKNVKVIDVKTGETK